MDYVIVAALVANVLGVFALLLSSSGRSRRERLQLTAQLTALERKLDAVVTHLGVVIPGPSFPAVESLVRQGRRIEAIKLYREQTGADLLTAKNTVDMIGSGPF
ncbi:hypothetical protein [Winogradskya humida]|uniref:Ribosomal L7/L12-like protein n=1 Tax=Winogradskya humida TaxID=113566 RepID=A0ABQ3ZTE5_9ACTN|nr:hypothetical protein [Actinoplanes humidus]GIE21880.1 hypothetical protein Ahu01nite_049820 [Actinoplanes humidus]